MTRVEGKVKIKYTTIMVNTKPIICSRCGKKVGFVTLKLRLKIKLIVIGFLVAFLVQIPAQIVADIVSKNILR